MYPVLGLILLFGVLIFVVGWMALVIIGIVQLRKGHKNAGLVLTILGGAWGLVAVVATVAGIYGVTRAEKYSNANVMPFNPASYHGQTGKIITSYKGQSKLSVIQVNGTQRWQLSTSDGTLQAPVGAYSPILFVATAGDRSGTWMASSFTSSHEHAIIVKADAPARLDFGPPFTASVAAGRVDGNRNITLNLAVRDSSGHSYMIRHLGPADVSGPGAAAYNPGFVVLDNMGKTVWQGNFQYG